MVTNQEPTSNLPLNCSLRLVYILSFIIAALMTVASIAGLLYKTIIYPTDELLQSFLPTDVVILFIGLPFLISSLWLSRRGKLIGLLLWPGALFFVLYNYMVYIFAMPLNGALLLHLALVSLSAYALTALLAGIDGKAVKQMLTNSVPERFGGGILAGFGFLFFLQVIFALANALTNNALLSETELALHTTDFLIAPSWVICGVLLWRRKEFGYVTALGLFFQASMLFVGLIVLLLLQPLLTGVPFSLVDVLVTFAMGLICFIPFTLFVRGVVSATSSRPGSSPV